MRNVGEALVEKIVDEREANGPFESIYDFVRRVDPGGSKPPLDGVAHQGREPSTRSAWRASGFLLKVDEIVEVTLSRRKDLSLGITTLFAAFGDGRRQRLGGDRGRALGHRVRTRP